MPKISVKEYGQENKKVILLIGGWTYKSYMLSLPARILARHGYYCITYTYDDAVFSPNVHKTVSEIMIIKDTLVQRIKALHEKGYEAIHLFGTSLGCVLTILVANESPFISHIILNTAGADVAESVWYGDLYKKFINHFNKKNVTFEKLYEGWKVISPQHNIQNIQDKKILIMLAKNDTVIPYSQGEKFVYQLKENNNSVSVHINKYLNHSLSGIYNLLNIPKYRKFIEE